MQFAEKFGISERTARNYFSSEKIDGAFITGKTWNISADAILPQRGSACKKASPLLASVYAPERVKISGVCGHRYAAS